MKLKGAVICSQEPTTGPYHEPHESGPHPYTLFLFKKKVPKLIIKVFSILLENL